MSWQHDSLEKLDNLLDACKRMGVETSPMAIDSLGIIPLFSWYHEVSVAQYILLNCLAISYYLELNRLLE